MNSKEIAKEMMDVILYDNDFITRWTPFDESRHYGDWLDKIAGVVAKSIETLGEDFYTEVVIETLSCGMYEDMMELIEKNPSLREVNDIINQYFDWLETMEYKNNFCKNE